MRLECGVWHGLLNHCGNCTTNSRVRNVTVTVERIPSNWPVGKCENVYLWFFCSFRATHNKSRVRWACVTTCYRDWHIQSKQILYAEIFGCVWYVKCSTQQRQPIAIRTPTTIIYWFVVACDIWTVSKINALPDAMNGSPNRLTWNARVEAIIHGTIDNRWFVISASKLKSPWIVWICYGNRGALYMATVFYMATSHRTDA